MRFAMYHYDANNLFALMNNIRQGYRELFDNEFDVINEGICHKLSEN